MTLQQLRYVDQVATVGSISEAARKLFVSQPTLTEAVRTLEEELRIAIFNRSAKGVTVTREGEEFLASARQILDDAGRIQEKYTGKAVRRPQFAVSCQHYAFAVEAFMEVVKACTAKSYDFTLRETVTSEIIDDVARNRSEIGILYLSSRTSSSGRTTRSQRRSPSRLANSTTTRTSPTSRASRTRCTSPRRSCPR